MIRERLQEAARHLRRVCEAPRIGYATDYDGNRAFELLTAIGGPAADIAQLVIGGLHLTRASCYEAALRRTELLIAACGSEAEEIVLHGWGTTL